MLRHFGGLNEQSVSGPLLVQQRNRLVESFLEEADLDWLWMLDNDITFPPDALAELLRVADPVERPIVGGLYCSWDPVTRRALPVAYLEADDGLWAPIMRWPAGSVVRVGAVGTGALLVHRRVFEVMAEAGYGPEFPWFAFGLNGVFGGAGEDLEFCRRAGECGFPVHVHTGVPLGHLKEIEVTVADFVNQLGDAGPHEE